MQGIAMILVVLGHLLVGNFVPAWYSDVVRGYLYSFHMALFFFISGFLAMYSYRPISSYQGYHDYVMRKFKKFFPPFIVIGGLCLLLSMESGENYWRKLGESFWQLFLAPRTSNAGYLWYIYLLFFFYCLIPVLSLKNGIVFIGEVLVAILLLFFPIQTEILVLDHFSRFFVFFLAGTVCSSKINFWRLLYSI